MKTHTYIIQFEVNQWQGFVGIGTSERITHAHAQVCILSCALCSFFCGLCQRIQSQHQWHANSNSNISESSDSTCLRFSKRAAWPAPSSTAQLVGREPYFRLARSLGDTNARPYPTRPKACSQSCSQTTAWMALQTKRNQSRKDTSPVSWLLLRASHNSCILAPKSKNMHCPTHGLRDRPHWPQAPA